MDDAPDSILHPLDEVQAREQAGAYLRCSYSMNGARNILNGILWLALVALAFVYPRLILLNLMLWILAVIVLTEVGRSLIDRSRRKRGLTLDGWPLTPETIPHLRRLSSGAQWLGRLVFVAIAAMLVAPYFPALAAFKPWGLYAFFGALALLKLYYLVTIGLWEESVELLGYGLACACLHQLDRGAPGAVFYILGFFASLGAGDLLNGLLLHRRWKRCLADLPPEEPQAPTAV